jgi:hypothetical protein
MGAYISLNTHPNHTSGAVWAQGVKCRGPFFRSTAVQVQDSKNLSKAQSPSSPVVHGSQKYKKEMAFSHQPNPKPKEEKPSPFHPQAHASQIASGGSK